MILYNTLMGVAAGLALVLVPVLIRKLYRRDAIAPEGWSLTFGILGVILAFLGGLMTVTWPLTVNPPINIAFAEPTLVLGLLLLAASFFLWRERESLRTLHDKKTGELTLERLQGVLRPVSWLIFALGLILLSCALAIFRFTLVGGAPEAEPITGLLHHMPWVENSFFGIIYGLAALGALLAPWAVRPSAVGVRRLAGVAWFIAGVCFLLFSAMNYYTHIGLLVNLGQGKDFEF